MRYWKPEERGGYKFTASKRNVTRKVSKCVTSRDERKSRGNVAGLIREEWSAGLPF
jgi:hypothetical protein